MVNNDKADATGKIHPNENYARELLQLFTIGEVLLNDDGTPRAGPAPYTEDDVKNLARVFTGWTYPTQPGMVLRRHNPAYWYGPMEAFESNHYTGAKTLLGQSIPGGLSAADDLSAALNIILAHPNVAPFVSKQLIEHLVTSNPSKEYVGRVAAVFNGKAPPPGIYNSCRTFLCSNLPKFGDLGAVVQAILLDPEARAGDTPGQAPANSGHLREPVLFIAGLLRNLGATVPPDTNALYNNSNNMGQNLFRPPSVFNYFSPNYRIANTGGLVGPEFQIFSPSTSLTRINFVNTMVYGNLGGGVTLDLTPLAAFASNPAALVDAVNAQLMHGQMSSQAASNITTAVNAVTGDLARARAAVYLAAASSEYQVEH